MLTLQLATRASAIQSKCNGEACQLWGNHCCWMCWHLHLQHLDRLSKHSTARLKQRLRFCSRHRVLCHISCRHNMVSHQRCATKTLEP